MFVINGCFLAGPSVPLFVWRYKIIREICEETHTDQVFCSDKHWSRTDVFIYCKLGIEIIKITSQHLASRGEIRHFLAKVTVALLVVDDAYKFNHSL